MNKKCIILSYGPVPTPEHTKVEGGGLRCWGLAKGIQSQGNVDVTVAYNVSYKQEAFTDSFEGVIIATWEISGIEELVAGYDTIVVSYCMGPLSVKVADVIRPDQQLVLDCYVPIYVEVSARDTDDLDREYNAFHGDVGRWAHVLRRGDLFMCASLPQLRYYKGVLSAIGRINPATYGHELILIVPYGIYRDEPEATHTPITDLVRNKEPKKLLWFGGIYPWFDLRMLVDAVALLNKRLPARLVIVGAKNPFNDHPDFTRPYDELMEHIEKNKLQDVVVMQDWVSFDDRANWYLDSDMVVVVNKIGEENELSWRTRLVDFMWANLPIITNGGDPLGEELLQHDAAAHFTSLDPQGMATDMQRVLEDGAGLKKLRANLKALKKNYYWDAVTVRLAEKIADHFRAPDLSSFGFVEHGHEAPASLLGKLKKVPKKAKMLPDYRRKHGTRNTYLLLRTVAMRRVRRVLPKRDAAVPKVKFVAHQMDLSGAPFVFMEMVEEFRTKYPKTPLEFWTFNPTHKDNLVALNKMGIKPRLYRTKDIGLPINAGDVVVLNTVAHSGAMKNSIFSSLESNEAAKLIWYIHEDEPEMQFNSGEKERIARLLVRDKIEMYIVSNHAARNYQKYFDTKKNIFAHHYRFSLPSRYAKVRQSEDFESLRFILPGTASDGRKGQLPVFYALAEFKKRYYDAAPEAYRDFKLVFVGLEDDFLSRQILEHADHALGKHFVHYGKVSRHKVFDIMQETNVTICYSLREALPLFVFEGMYAGHIVLRNNCSGMEEQLIEGKNGYELDSTNFEALIMSFEKVLNKKKTSSSELAAMSKTSFEMVAGYENNDYSALTKSIADSLAK